MPVTADDKAPESSRLGWLYYGFAVVVFAVTLGSMFVGFTEVLYGAIALAFVGSVGLGVLSMRHRWSTPKEGAILFAKPWLWMAAFAGLSLVNGKWQPMMFFGALAACVTLLFWVGTLLGAKYTKI